MDKLEQQILNDMNDAGGIKALTADLISLRNDLKSDCPNDYDPDFDNDMDYFCDVRLRYHDNNFSLKTGSSDYDQDHRGSWGCSSIGPDMDDNTCRDIAINLLDQVIESAYESV